MSASYGIQNIFSHASRKRCMANLKRKTLPKFGKDPEETAAVLVPLCKVKGVPSLLFTARCTNQHTTCGEVTFPGGKSGPKETPIETALRETELEIGLLRQKVDVWGAGPAVPGRHNKIMITPIIGSIANVATDDLKVDDKSVAEVFAIAVELLCDPKNQFHAQFRHGYILPAFVVEQYKIRGITAYITHAFLSSVLSRNVYDNDWMKRKLITKNEITTIRKSKD